MRPASQFATSRWIVLLPISMTAARSSSLLAVAAERSVMHGNRWREATTPWEYTAATPSQLLPVGTSLAEFSSNLRVSLTVCTGGPQAQADRPWGEHPTAAHVLIYHPRAVR